MNKCENFNCSLDKNQDCSICIYNPKIDLKELQKAKRSYTPTKLRGIN